MSYRIRGRFDGGSVSATWTDTGRLEGDPALLGAAAQLVSAGAPVRPTPTSDPIVASLDDGWSALLTLTSVLMNGDGFRWEGVEGEAPDPPPWFQMPPPFDPDVIY